MSNQTCSCCHHESLLSDFVCGKCYSTTYNFLEIKKEKLANLLLENGKLQKKIDELMKQVNDLNQQDMF